MEIDTSPANYEQQLDTKLDVFQEQLRLVNISASNIEVFKSPLKNFRMRTEFRVWHEGDEAHYAMHHPQTKQVYTLTEFPIASEAICQCMPKLIDEINANEQLKCKLFQVEFLSTTGGELLISMIYHRPLKEDWEEQARQLEKKLGVYIIGRSRKQKVVLSQDYVTEQMLVDDTTFFYQQTENGFTQPNATVCQKMLQWVSQQATILNNDKAKDLLELYCGNGNFTLPLSTKFRKILATEVSKTSVRSAQFNINKNAITNVNIMRLSSEETVQALNKEREFRRLQDIELDTYDFSTVFVDPPRAGLDESTLALIKRFDNIIYISCNPETFIQNVKLLDEYSVHKLAAFDQFPYTHHLEVGAILMKRKQ